MFVRDSIHIDAPGEKIWAYMIDPEKIMKWCITFQQFKYVSEQHQGVNTEIFIKEKASGLTMNLDFKVTDWVENEKIAFSKISGRMPKSYTQEWMLETENGGSKFTFQEQIVMPMGFIGRLIENAGKSSSKATVKKMLAILKENVESE